MEIRANAIKVFEKIRSLDFLKLVLKFLKF